MSIERKGLFVVTYYRGGSRQYKVSGIFELMNHFGAKGQFVLSDEYLHCAKKYLMEASREHKS